MVDAVLTAAHCFFYSDTIGLSYNLDAIEVLVGAVQMLPMPRSFELGSNPGVDGTHWELLSARDVKMPKEFSYFSEGASDMTFNYAYDVAILQLSASISTAVIPSDYQLPSLGKAPSRPL